MSLREAGRSIYKAALEAVEPGRLVRASVLREGGRLRIAGESFDLDAFERIELIAFGKAAAGMAGAVAGILGDRLSGGLVVAPAPGKSGDDQEQQPAGKVRADSSRKAGEKRPAASKDRIGEANRAALRRFPGGDLEFLTAAHPLPDETSVTAARRALDLARQAGGKGLVLICVSGGGSSLLALPADGITLEEKRSVIEALLRSGASIRDLNVVRKHISGVKGGRLAETAYPAAVVSLVISDVPGDDLETIASGPAHWDSSTFADAVDVLKKYRLWAGCPASVRTFLGKGSSGARAETLKEGDPVFGRVREFVIGNNLTALRGAKQEAERLGFAPFVLASSDEGEARKAARSYVAFMASLACSMSGAPKPVCFLAGGELTVTVKGRGAGGRNMEFVLAALAEMRKEGFGSVFCEACAVRPEGEGPGGNQPLGWLVLSLGTDGIDGPSDAAGAWADSSIFGRIDAMGLDPGKSLDDNDSYSFFKKTGNLIVTGPTGTNVCDVRVFLIRPV
jgi:glycerate-2-kinase